MARLEDYETHDALGLAELVARGELTPGELLDTAIDRVEKRNPDLNALVIPLYREARAALDSDLPDGPFRGVPFLLKDLHLLLQGTRTTSGSRLFEDYVADHDSELVARYKRAGLVIFGKTASPELGLTTSTESRLFGQTRNPWSREHMAGGSSGGAAAAVAAGFVPMAHASDGGGSIRIPASCCGLFGLKPTRARLPQGPDQGEGWSGMSTSHVVSRSVRDSAAVLDATQGPDLGAPYQCPPPERPFLDEVGRPPGRLRIAVQIAPWNGAETHADCVAAAEDAARLCTELGHRVEKATLEIERESLREATGLIIAASTYYTLAARARALGRELREDDVEPATWAMVGTAKGADAAAYVAATRAMHRVGRLVARFFEDYDVLLTPTMATPPVRLGILSLSNPDRRAYLENLMRTTGFTGLFNVSGSPAMSVPLAWNDAGLPIGIQFASRFGDEASLIRLAAQLEQARPWAGRRP